MSALGALIGSIALPRRVISAFAQAPSTVADQLPTDQRLLRNGWWPTKPSNPADFVGAQKCAQCHGKIFNSQSVTAMAVSMPPPIAMLPAGKPVDYRTDPYSYQLKPDAKGVQFSVRDEASSISEQVGWVFGSGRMGQSFLLTRNGSFYEGRISYLDLIKRFEITPGQSTARPASLEKAFGHRLTDKEARNCFGCHATDSVTATGIDTVHMVAGVTCEACHGPGADHVAAESAQVQGEPMILNPARLRPPELVDFCGSCHRTWWDTVELGFTGIATVRFPAYRLERSRCWGNGDRRLTCVACHDPHRDLVRDASFYDTRCLACHVNGAGAKPDATHPGPACPKNTKQCVTCHMPKYELPGMHLMFTDHQIRIARPGEKFPG